MIFLFNDITLYCIIVYKGVMLLTKYFNVQTMHIIIKKH